jgi:purine-nucleoside phosphorylase
VSGLAEIGEAVRAIASRTPMRPAVGLVLGSGLGGFAQTLEKPVVIPYGAIPHFPASTAIGHKGELALGRSEGVPVAVMSGRVHFYEGYRPDQVVFPVRVLARLGVKILVLTNAAGSVNVNYRPGELMVIADHINLMGFNPLVGPNDEQLGPRFFDMSEAYDPALRRIAEKACAQVGVTVRQGVYVAVAGPSYETPAEIRAFRTLGADAVGMSTVPEVIAARHAGVRVLAISCITNLAAGVSKKKLDHLEVLEVGRKVQASLADVLGRIIQEAARQV